MIKRDIEPTADTIVINPPKLAAAEAKPVKKAKENVLSVAEWDRLEWCRANLDIDQLEKLEEDARELAEREVNAPVAYEEGLPLMVKILVHELRASGKQR